MKLLKFEEFNYILESSRKDSLLRSSLINELVLKNSKVFKHHNNKERIWLLSDINTLSVIEILKSTVTNSTKFNEIENINIISPNQVGFSKNVVYSGSFDTIEFDLDGISLSLTINNQISKNIPTTEQQEKCSIFLFEKALKGGSTNVSDYIPELEKIWPQISSNSDWLSSFQGQVSAINEYMQGVNVKNYSFFRDSSFSVDLYKHAKKLIGFDKKDAWNPADVWIVDNPDKRIQEITNIEYDPFLNAYLSDRIKDKTILPISLKKVGNVVSLQELNIENASININDSPTKIELDLLFDNNKKTFERNGAVIITKNRISFDFRFSNTRTLSFAIEGNMIGGTARLGKIPTSIYRKHLGIDLIWRNWSGKFKEKEIIELYKKIQGHKKKYKEFNTKETTPDVKQFIEGMMYLYENSIERYYEKCLAMEAINSTLEKDPKKIIQIFIAASQKVGKDFGPFIKIS